MDKQELGIDTSIKTVRDRFLADGRQHFVSKRSVWDRALDILLPVLWFFAVAVAAGSFYWLQSL